MADEFKGRREFLSKIWVIFGKVPYALTSNRIIDVLQINTMGVKHRLYQILGGSFATTLAFFMVSPALAEELQNWSFDATKSELSFSLSDTVFPEFFLISEPPRLVLDIPQTEIGNIDSEQIYSGVVQSIRVAQHTAEKVRVVIELSPEIVLAPEQADIQFDTGDNGQRHWRFRPLLAETANAVAERSSTSTALDSRSRNGLSLSAANLALPTRQSASTTLPIDPYEAESASTTVVSVPPLEESSNVDVVTVPDLPPMTVPQLEETNSVADLGVQAHPTSSLEPLERELSPLPELEVAVSEDDTLATNSILEAVPTTAESIVGAEASETADTVNIDDSFESVDGLVETPQVEMSVVEPESETLSVFPVSESVTEEIMHNKPTETALAPIIETSPIATQSPQVDRGPSAAPALQTIQQPAANRTIIQTEPIAPIPFGQPLPSANEL
ncbi:MAG: AMIN domain-containing protein [Leptolyngbya sp. SIO3F4]|nr:AMIN domain-containing protein [Leptolyngbya sp. SIO3F4]